MQVTSAVSMTIYEEFSIRLSAVWKIVRAMESVETGSSISAAAASPVNLRAISRRHTAVISRAVPGGTDLGMEQILMILGM